MKKTIFILLITCLWNTTKGQMEPIDSGHYPKPVNFTAQQDHDNMMQQLGIKQLRPGPNGNPNAPDHANYDESKTNPCPQLPDILTKNAGKKVTTPEMWWKVRRPELVKALEEEVYGKLPANIPKVNWEVKTIDHEFIFPGFIPVVAKQIVGHVDNSEYPLIHVDIKMMLVLPMNVKGPVPVLMMFGFPSFPAPTQPSADDMEKLNTVFKEMIIKTDPSVKKIFDKYPAFSPVTRLPGPNFFAPAPAELSPTEQLLQAGWGYCTIDPNSIQADNGAGITRGIIGLINKGQPRKPDQWGALRCMGMGSSTRIRLFRNRFFGRCKKSRY